MNQVNKAIKALNTADSSFYLTFVCQNQRDGQTLGHISFILGKSIEKLFHVLSNFPYIKSMHTKKNFSLIYYRLLKKNR